MTSRHTSKSGLSTSASASSVCVSDATVVVDANTANLGLLDFGLAMLNGVVCDDGETHYPICINPIQATRAWAALREISCEKTNSQLGEMINKILRLPKKSEDSQPVLTAMGREANSDCARIVNIFYEHQGTVPFEQEVIAALDSNYGNSDYVPVFRTISYLSDHKGIMTTAKINREVAYCTYGAVKLTVPMEERPNSLTQCLLVSAADCTFHWKTSAEVTFANCWFMEKPDVSSSRAKVETLICKQEFRSFKAEFGQCVELDGYSYGSKLYLLLPKSGTSVYEMIKQLSSESIMTLVENTSSAQPTNQTLSIPNMNIERGLSIGKLCMDKQYCAKRVFDREKSELTKVIYKSHSHYKFCVRLWEHYHGTVFRINRQPPETVIQKRQRRDAEFNPPEALQSVMQMTVAVDVTQTPPKKRGTETPQTTQSKEKGKEGEVTPQAPPSDERTKGGAEDPVGPKDWSTPCTVTSLPGGETKRKYGMHWNRKMSTYVRVAGNKTEVTDMPGELSYNSPFFYVAMRGKTVFCMGIYTTAENKTTEEA